MTTKPITKPDWRETLLTMYVNQICEFHQKGEFFRAVRSQTILHTASKGKWTINKLNNEASRFSVTRNA